MPFNILLQDAIIVSRWSILFPITCAVICFINGWLCDIVIVWNFFKEAIGIESSVIETEFYSNYKAYTLQ